MAAGFLPFDKTVNYGGTPYAPPTVTAPMALAALIAWLRNPYKGNRAEVAVNRISGREWLFMLVLTAAVTAVFGFMLAAFGTANLPSRQHLIAQLG